MIDATSESDIKTEFTAEELCNSLDMTSLGNALSKLVGDEIVIRSSSGTTLFGNPGPEPVCRTPICIDFEPIAWLECQQTSKSAEAAADLLQSLLISRARYHMAAAMHKSVTASDYELLQQKNRELEASNQRYRSLANSLEHKVAEQVQTIEASQRTLYENAKMAAVGELAAGVAHEINNPIGFISSNLGSQNRYHTKISAFFEEFLPSFPDTAKQAYQNRKLEQALNNWQQVIVESQDGCKRVSTIVSSLRTFSSIDQQAWDDIDLQSTITNVIQVTLYRFGDQVPIEFSPGPPAILRCQPGYIAEAIFSLLSNALEAASQSTQPLVVVYLDRCADRFEIKIRDNGPGIDPDLIDSIFNPFFTTKEVGQGTGLGLSVCRDISAAHGGHLSVSNCDPAGALAVLSLPQKQASEP